MFRSKERKIRKVLNDYRLPYLDIAILDDSICKKFELQEDRLSLELFVDFPADAIRESVSCEVKTRVLAVDDKLDVDIHVESKIRCHKFQGTMERIVGVKNIIAVASGKGGVGKSTSTVNLAMALAKTGVRVGVLDADIYGPSIPKMLGTANQELQGEDKKFHPIFNHGVYSTSIAYMIDADKALVWRGPMVSRALQQLIHETMWPDLDYLFIDLPPGTGDVQLTLAQKIPVNGAIIITTPQDISLIDARRAINLFDKVGISVLGVIENMSQHVCSQCGHAEALFGEGGGQELANQHNVTLLGQLPLDINIRSHADQGESLFETKASETIASIYKETCLNIIAELSRQPIDYKGKFPKVVVQ